jgi:hypothetical protein
VTRRQHTKGKSEAPGITKLTSARKLKKRNTFLIASVVTPDKTLSSTVTMLINFATAMATSESPADDGYHQLNTIHGTQATQQLPM